MDAVEYLKQLKRMCNDRECNECPLRKNIFEIWPCVPYEMEDEKMVVEIVEKWAKDHPAKTRQSEFLKIVPNAITDADGNIRTKPCLVDEKLKAGNCGNKDCGECTREYWREEIE